MDMVARFQEAGRAKVRMFGENETLLLLSLAFL
jgi:hypothetical protein